MKSIRKIIKAIDFSYFFTFLSEATLGVTFLLYIFIARVVGPGQYGIFSAAASLGGILAFFTQFGFSALINREVANNPKEGAKNTYLYLFIESLNSLFILLLLLPLSIVLGFQDKGILICFCLTISEICRGAKQTVRGVYRGNSQYKSETILLASERIILGIIASLVLIISKDLFFVTAAFAGVRIIDLFVVIFILSRQFTLFSAINSQTVWNAVKKAYPFALTGILWVVYYQIDLLMLNTLSTSEQVGFYSASYRIFEIFLTLPRIIFLVSFTKLARHNFNDKPKLSTELFNSVILLILFVLPFIIAAGLLSVPLVNIIYGSSFYAAIPSLVILLPSLGIKMFGTLIQYFFEATNREKILPPLLLTTVIFNISANAILIPLWGALGAALATLISEFIFTIFGSIMLIRIKFHRIGFTILYIALLCLLVSLIPSLIFYKVNIYLCIASFAICVLLIAVITRKYKKSSIKPRTL